LAAAKGWPAPVWYSDEGISGAKEAANRPNVARLMADVRAGLIQAVIVLDLSRLSRVTRLTLELVDEMRRAGVAFVSIKESFDTDTPSGYLMMTMMAALAEYERELIRMRTRAALGELSRRDGDAGGRLPFGYVRDVTMPNKVRVERAAAQRVRRIFAWRDEGLTLRAIAAQLNKMTQSPRGARWHASSVAAVLANEAAYRGGLRGASQIHWPVILHEDSAAAGGAAGH